MILSYERSLKENIDEGIKTAQNLAARYERGIPTTTSIQAKAIADLALADAAKAKIAADLALSKTNVDFATRKLSEDLAEEIEKGKTIIEDLKHSIDKNVKKASS